MAGSLLALLRQQGEMCLRRAARNSDDPARSRSHHLCRTEFQADEATDQTWAMPPLPFMADLTLSALSGRAEKTTSRHLIERAGLVPLSTRRSGSDAIDREARHRPCDELDAAVRICVACVHSENPSGRTRKRRREILKHRETKTLRDGASCTSGYSGRRILGI